MRTFRHLMVVGISTVLAFSENGTGLAETLQGSDRPHRPPSDTPTRQTEPLPIAENPAAIAPENIAVPDLNDRPQTVPADRSGQLSQVQANPNLEAPLPEYLNPDPNPLQFPTESEDVEIVGTQPITLEQAIDLAELNSQQLQEALLTLERSRAALREARAALYPNLDVRSNLTRANSAGTELANERQRNLLGDNANPQDETDTTLDGTVELSYNLYTSGRRPAQIQLAETQVRLNQLEVERVGAELRFNVREAYYNLQEADDQVRISRQSVESAERSLRDAQALERAGLGTRFDVLRARVQLADSVQSLTQALSQQRIRRREIAQLLNVSQVVDISAAEDVEIAGIWSLPLEDSILLALKNRAELEQLLLQRDLNELQEKVALSALGPQVSLFANYNLVEVFNDDLGVADGYSLGGRVQWSLYDGGAARARAAQEQKNIQIAETQFSQLRDQIRLQVEQAFFNLRSNFENIQTANVAVEQASESLRLARLRFQAGVGTQSDVLDAETELTRAENNRLRAIVSYNRALAAMQRAITNLDGNTLTDLP